MSWNDPNGQKQRDPWGQGDGKGPPDLDEAWRKARQKLKSSFGGGRGGSGGSSGASGPGASGAVIIVLLLAAAWLVYDSLTVVDEGELGVVLRFGEYQRTMGPGLNVHFPRPVERVETVDVQQVREASHEAHMLTSDENIVTLSMSVQYQVKNAQDFLFQVRMPEETLQEAAESSLREVVGSHKMDFVLGEGRAQVASETKTLLQDIVDRYGTGLRVNLVNLENVRPPQQVKDAFDDAIKAREDRERFVNEAQAYANQIIPEARGQAARIVEESRAYRESIIARSQGDAKRFSLLLEEYKKAPQITRRRMYLETMEEVLSQASKVIVDVKGGQNLMYLPLDELMRRRGGEVPYRLSPGDGSGGSSSGSGTNTVTPDQYRTRQPDRSRGGSR